MVLGAFGFVALFIWIWFITDWESESELDLLADRIIAVVGAGVFGLCGIYALTKLFDTKPGLIIDEQGIVDNSSTVAPGRILWHEIVGLSTSTISGVQMLTIDVVDPQKYIDQGNFFIRKLNQANTRMTGSPINIAATTLKVDFDNLVRMMTVAFDKANVDRPQREGDGD